jgi:hypothetical protein
MTTMGTTLLLLVAAATAQAGIGVVGVSRFAAAPGDEVRLTLGCGLCYPPCNGPAAAGPGKTCIPGKKLPPREFPVSLVPIEKAPKLRQCGPRALCSAGAPAPPSHAPFSYLGEATPPGGHVDGVPRYRVDFEVPRLRPGTYVYVIFCSFCLPGKRGTLLTFPTMRAGRLVVKAPDPRATIAALSMPAWR